MKKQKLIILTIKSLPNQGLVEELRLKISEYRMKDLEIALDLKILDESELDDCFDLMEELGTDLALCSHLDEGIDATYFVRYYSNSIHPLLLPRKVDSTSFLARWVCVSEDWENQVEVICKDAEPDLHVVVDNLSAESSLDSLDQAMAILKSIPA